jgi:hypothetical protein
LKELWVLQGVHLLRDSNARTFCPVRWPYRRLG